MFWFAGLTALAVTLAMFWRRTTREPAIEKEEFAPQIGTSVAAGEIVYGDSDAKPTLESGGVAEGSRPR